MTICKCLYKQKSFADLQLPLKITLNTNVENIEKFTGLKLPCLCCWLLLIGDGVFVSFAICGGTALLWPAGLIPQCFQRHLGTSGYPRSLPDLCYPAGFPNTWRGFPLPPSVQSPTPSGLSRNCPLREPGLITCLPYIEVSFLWLPLIQHLVNMGTACAPLGESVTAFFPVIFLKWCARSDGGLMWYRKPLPTLKVIKHLFKRKCSHAHSQISRKGFKQKEKNKILLSFLLKHFLGDLSI